MPQQWLKVDDQDASNRTSSTADTSFPLSVEGGVHIIVHLQNMQMRQKCQAREVKAGLSLRLSQQRRCDYVCKSDEGDSIRSSRLPRGGQRVLPSRCRIHRPNHSLTCMNNSRTKILHI